MVLVITVGLLLAVSAVVIEAERVSNECSISRAAESVSEATALFSGNFFKVNRMIQILLLAAFFLPSIAIFYFIERC